MRFALRFFCLSLLLICGYTGAASGDGLIQLQTDVRFRPLPDNRKLSQLVINDIVQDDKGFVWIATDDGLNRYDGHDNQIYRPSVLDSDKINHFAVKRLAVDLKGELWVGSEGGLNLYQADSDTFVSVIPSSQNHLGDIDKKIRALKVDNQDRLWIGTRTGGVVLLSNDRKRIEKIPLADTQLAGRTLFVHDFFQAQNNTIYAATRRGLLRFDEAQNRLLLVAATKQKNITRVHGLPDGRLLLGSSKGLWLYEPGSDSLSSLLPTQMQNKHIVDIEPFDRQQLFIGTRSNGLYLLNLQSNSLRHFTADPADKYALTDNQIDTIYRTEDGLFWVGTNIGIDIFDPQQLRFGHISAHGQDPLCLAGNTIYAMMQSSRDQLWIASYGHGLNRIDLQSGQCRFIQGLPQQKGNQLFKDVVTLHENGENVWIGTFKDGVIQYNQTSGQFTPLSGLVDTQGKLPMSVQAINSDGDGNIWIATYDAGLFFYQPKTQQMRRFVPKAAQGWVGAFNDVAVDVKGNVWAAGASSGLWLLTPDSDSFVLVEGIAERLWSIDIDRDGVIWVGTAGSGAIKFQPDTAEKTKYTLNQGLLSNVVLNIRQDNQGNMWLFTDRGLSRLDTQTGKIRTFLESDGLQGNTFTTAGFFDRQSNILWTGGVNGLNRFKPDDIKPLNRSQQVRLTKFELYYKPVELKARDKRSPLHQVIGQTNKLALSHRQNVFSFGFSALEYAAPDLIRFAFKLDGYDDDWNIVEADRRYANYTNIDPGEYVFRVKATNSEGQWSNVQTTMEIVIEPPWWSTKPAMVGYLLTLWLAVYLFVAFRTRSLRNTAKRLEAAVNKRTEELATEKQKVEQLLARKNEEFATVSHEFRTPLTLILGPLAQLLDSARDQQQQSKLSMIQRNGYRLLRMVDQLLHLQTFKVRAINQKQTQQVGQIVRLVCEAFTDLAKEKHIELKVKQVAEVNFALVPDAMEKILLNLLSNAVKYSNPGSEISVSSVRTDTNLLNIKVSDTGIGIPADKADKVFERYHRVHDKQSEKVSGAGIGLALVKSLVEVHGGHIELRSKVGVGTCVEVYLPIIDEVESQQMAAEANNDLVAMELMSITGGPAPGHQVVTEDKDQDSTQLPLILVIEDNPDMCSYIIQAIESQYRVISAPDGRVGVEMAIEQLPDVIISDIMMPHKDGYQVTRELRQNTLTDHIPIILLTAKGDRDSRLKGWDEKADEYLTKPFDVAELNIRLANLLEIRNILKRSFAEKAFVQVAESAGVNEPPVVQHSSDDRQRQFVEKLDQTLETFYTDASVSMADFAAKMAMSERQLFRKLKSVLDMTPSEYLRRFRLEKACRLLAEGQSVSFVSLEVGFSTQSYFGKCFKAQYGMSPGEFKKTCLTD